MATRKSSRPASNRSRQTGSGGFGGFLLGVLVTACIAAAAAYYFHVHLPGFHTQRRNLSQASPAQPSGTPGPASSSDSEHKPHPPPLAAPPATAPRAPFPISEDVFEAGARLYVKASPGGTSCATCHGTPNRIGAKMPEHRPGASQFFSPDSSVTKSPSQLFVHTKYGVTGAPGMPVYAGTLTDTQIWQIALLLSNADQTYPDPVTKILARHR